MWKIVSVSKKRMTLDQAEAARQRAVKMYENFGDSDAAADFDALTSSEYAELQGIELISSNPGRGHRSYLGHQRPNTSRAEKEKAAMTTK